MANTNAKTPPFCRNVNKPLVSFLVSIERLLDRNMIENNSKGSSLIMEGNKAEVAAQSSLSVGTHMSFNQATY